MFSTGYGVRVDRIVRVKLDELRENPRYQDKGTGFVHTSATGEGTEGFYLQRGGIWNDTDGRSSTGVTKTDVKDVRSALNRIGVKLSFDDVDNLLCRAYALTDGGSRATLYATEVFELEVKDYWKEQRRVRVEKLRAAGKCIMCGKESTDDGKSTCSSCGKKANARAKKRKIAA
jgi:ribosomal protein L37E